MGRRFRLSAFQLTLAAGLAFGCSSSGKLPPPDPYTRLPTSGGGSPGGGTPLDGGSTDAGEDAGPDSGVCDGGGCLQLGQACQPDVPNGGCAPGLICQINLNNDTTYTCQSLGGDF